MNAVGQRRFSRLRRVVLITFGAVAVAAMARFVVAPAAVRIAKAHG